ncbi:hypothetical protein MCOR27_007198 [Pyricularia oryzae]|uniref:DUF6590 domain-containing protein n=2 Tax=Pyricularia TaxID=48558 RepID=A0ABQ8NJS0_PYRGI|nr:hypothetical protein MCOR01_005993 [Pyricularia oryzae]KAI6297651.1 hypothetical protein MCOR33_006086 [Pyricularia grisea]KAH9435239.1 hypothetical protein MCOR02_004189 [Pyricularia oryzae]KAI6259238.1 hypothetical protein MCOR19_004378 [Pyricularia oryzae]KAI6274885.1 hypothetical protein MCOR27_007198 [Pyricularia oryzae]
MASRAKSKSKRNSDKREHSLYSNEAEPGFDYDERTLDHSHQYEEEEYANNTYEPHPGNYNEHHMDEQATTPRTKHSKDEGLSTSYECEETPDAGAHEATAALSDLTITNEISTENADGTEAQEDEVHDNQYGYTSKGKNKQTAGVEDEYGYEESAGFETSTKPAKQVTFGEANDYGDHYEMYEDTVEASKRDYYSLDQVGESSTAATDTYQGEHTEYTPEVDILANAPKGPRLSAAIQPRIKDTRSGFKTHDSVYFVPGNVFKTLWPEPMGTSSRYTTVVQAEEKGKSIHVSTRRFIIVGNADNQSYCVPIFTYGKQGCKKKGLKPHRHGMVYSGEVPPEPLKNEPQLGYDPVRVYMEPGQQDLMGESRVNYSMLCTVQHNVKALFIGFISQDELENVVQPAVYSILDGARGKTSKHSKERGKGR